MNPYTASGAPRQAPSSGFGLGDLAKGATYEEIMRRTADALKNQQITRGQAAEIFKTGNLPRMAGSPNVAQRATQLLGKARNFNVGGVKVNPFRGLVALSALSAAADEFDDDDGLGTNIAQGVSRGGADLATNLGLATLGTALLPGIGTVAVPLIANQLGVQEKIGKMASTAGGGLYNTGKEIIEGVLGIDSEKRKTMKEIELAKMQADAANQIQADQLKMLGPLYTDLRKGEMAAELLQRERIAEILMNANRANTTNQMAVNAQQNAANSLNQLTAYLMN